MLQITPTQSAAAQRHKAFHASIARRAFVPRPPEVIVEVVRNTCAVAIESPLARHWVFQPPPDYSGMWFADLISYAERWAPKNEAPARKLQMLDIQKAVAEFYGVTVRDMMSARRTADLVRPRQVAMYLCKMLTLNSLPQIGRKFGGRDHTTVIHAVRKIALLNATDVNLASDLEALTISLDGVND